MIFFFSGRSEEPSLRLICNNDYEQSINEYKTSLDLSFFMLDTSHSNRF